MADNAFFDTNMVLGYCILLDQHHKKCKNFLIDNPDLNFYVSESVEEEYRRKKNTVSSRLENGVLDHVRNIQKGASSGFLDSIALDSLQRSQIDSGNPANQFLYDYYSIIKSNGINKSDLTENLRKLARSIHSIAELRRQELNKGLLGWVRWDDYPDIKSKLDKIHEPDKTHCIDAHDIAIIDGGGTILVTSDVKDIVGNSSLILAETEIDEIVDVSV